MARTISTIYDSLIQEKEKLSSLAALTPDPETSISLINAVTSTSKVAAWRSFFWVVAFGLWTIEKLWDDYKGILEQAARDAIVGSVSWYHNACLLFQYGDSLTEVSTGKWGYSVIDESKKIVKFAAIIEKGNELDIKIAKDDGTGVPEKLTSGELTAFETYIEAVKFAGTPVTVVSEDPDDLKVDIEVELDNMVIAPNGESISSPGDYPVEDAITEHLKNLEFNGLFRISKLVDAIQATDGVIDVTVNSIEYKYGALSYYEIETKVVPNAGYFAFDSGSSSIVYL